MNSKEIIHTLKQEAENAPRKYNEESYARAIDELENLKGPAVNDQK